MESVVRALCPRGSVMAQETPIATPGFEVVAATILLALGLL